MESGGFNPRARDGREFFKNSAFSLPRRFNPRARDGREYVAAYL